MEIKEPCYTITEETTLELRTSLAMNFYCDNVREVALANLKDDYAAALAKKAVMAADAFLNALSERQPDEKI